MAHYPCMAYAFANFHVALRTVLGDAGTAATGYDYHAEQLDGALATVVNMGFVPCVSVDPSGEALVEPPVNPATWGFMVAKAAHLLIGGATPESFRTRALSITVEASARRDTLSHIEAMLSELEAGGNVCGVAGDVAYKGLVGVQEDFITRFKVRHHCHHHHHP